MPVPTTTMCNVRRGRENGGTPAARVTRTMWDAGDLRHDFNAPNNTSWLTCNI
jgi:hypothetical protein